VTWDVYAHAQFSGGLYQDKVSIFILYKTLIDGFWLPWKTRMRMNKLLAIQYA
jgi:hypothetical protein